MKKVLSVLVMMILIVGCKKNINYEKKYKELEKSMLEATEKFIETNESILSEDKSASIGLANLYTGAYLIERLKDPKTNKECNVDDSFVHVELIEGEINYTVHLECGDYISK